jgi:hypothetical protein
MRLMRLTGLAPDGLPSTPWHEKSLDARLLLDSLVQAGNEAVVYSDLPDPGGHFVAAIRLYRDAIAWALDNDLVPSTDVGSADLSSKPRRLVALAGEQPSERIEFALNATLADLHSLSPSERMDLALLMRDCCKRLLRQTSAADSARVKHILRRPVRIGLTLVFITGLTMFGLYLGTTARNVNRGKPWRTSSSMYSCRPIELGGCAPRQGVFFHTKLEDSPWIEYDLGRRTSFRKIVVENSRDGYRERAVPLIAEASDDRTTWREVARKSSIFDVWTTAFPPVSARYVRFRVAGQSYLHLARVEIRN